MGGEGAGLVGTEPKHVAVEMGRGDTVPSRTSSRTCVTAASPSARQQLTIVGKYCSLNPFI